MEVPILKQGDYLIASVQAALSDSDLAELRDELSARAGRLRCHGVIVDVTVLDVIDSFTSRTLRDIAYISMMRGAQTVICGIQPEAAMAMVELGMTLEGMHTALDLEEGLALLDRMARRHGKHHA